jgi:hypothetical protein
MYSNVSLAVKLIKKIVMYKAIIVFLVLSVSLQLKIKKLKKVVDFFEAMPKIQSIKGLCDETMILQSISENAKGIKYNESPQAFLNRLVLFLKK